ncbi:sphingomyelin phosphodiesterase 3-like [Glandiceps talaboti]
MALYEAAFDNRCLNVFYCLSWYLIYPCYWAMNRLISCCLSTSDEIASREEDPCYERFVYLVVLIPTYLVIFIIFTPTAILGFCAWIIMQRYRHPYIYCYFESHHILEEWTNISVRHCFRIGTANVGLLPEAIARLNNLECPDWRAKEMGHRLANSQLRPKPKIFIESPSDNEIPRNTTPYSSMQNHQFSENMVDPVPLLESNVGKVTGDTLSPEHEERQLYTTLYDNHVGVGHEPLPNGITCNGTGCNGNVIRESQTYDSIQSDVSQDSVCIHENCTARMRTDSSGISIPDGSCYNNTYNPSRSTTNSDFPGSGSAPVDSNPSISLHGCGLSLSEEHSNGEFSPTMVKEDSRTFNENLSRCTHSVEINFPPQIDFMCFQEVYEPNAAKTLIKKIHPWFNHIIYDVGVNSWNSNLFMINSGLVVACRYPILEADFKYFQDSAKEDKVICKGILMTKVHLGNTRDKQRIVGYISVTQLQTGRQKSFIRLNQLNKVSKWLQEFKSKYKPNCVLEDLVAFDVLCGDFHFDNMSPGDMANWSHPLFTQYSDPCRVTPGLDHSWTVGTELNQDMIYEDEVATPEGLQRILEDPNSRGLFIQDVEPYSFSDCSIPSSSRDFQRYKGNGRRRTDLLMYNNKTTHCKQVCEEYYFISQFATLTDHIPVVLTCSSIEHTDQAQSKDSIPLSFNGKVENGVIEDSNMGQCCRMTYVNQIDNDDDQGNIRVDITYESTV